MIDIPHHSGAMSGDRANAEDAAQNPLHSKVDFACPALASWCTDFETADFEAIGISFAKPAALREEAQSLRTEAIRHFGHLPHEEISRTRELFSVGLAARLARISGRVRRLSSAPNRLGFARRAKSNVLQRTRRHHNPRRGLNRKGVSQCTARSERPPLKNIVIKETAIWIASA